VSLLVHQFDRATAPCVLGGRTGVMLLAAARHILGDPGVERAIGALHDLDEPYLTGQPGPRLTVLFRHPAKIPGHRG